MGTWGPGIFENDTACDVRAEFRDWIGDGLTPLKAVNKMKRSYIPSFIESDEHDFWLGLAATQVQCGRLVPLVRDEALKIIDSGADQAIWDEHEPKLARDRAKALAQLRKQILGPQRKPTRIGPAFRSSTDWKDGWAVAYRLRSGRWVAFRVVAIHEDRGGQHAIAYLLDWIGAKPPTESQVATAHIRLCRGGRDSTELRRKLALYETKRGEFPADRVVIVTKRLGRLKETSIGATFFGGWKDLDAYLKDGYGLE